ncbi:MAG: hypothetical protein IKT32_06820 [Clostridia bacterium]|nr:hypothetical protein [Clostridia bacterium]
MNKEALLSLEDTIAQTFLIEKVQQMINALSKSKNYEHDRVVALQAYNLLTEESKAQITGADILSKEGSNGGGCSSNVDMAHSVVFVVLCLTSCAYLTIQKRGGKYNEK